MNKHVSSSTLYENEISHEGEGHADFIDSKIRVKGYVKIAINESGESQILMDVKNIIIDGKTVETEVLQILQKQHLSTYEYMKLSKYMRVIDSDQCSQLQVNTKYGIFSTEKKENILCYWNGSRLVFSLLVSQFTIYQEKRAKYWVLPLQNYITDFSQGCPNITHPLRINDLNYRVITFDFERRFGFIEPLPNYSQIKEKLENGAIKNGVTALIIGEIGDHSIEFSSLARWFPFDYLGILSLATGSEVSASWIEFRSQEGELVSRIYPRFRVPCYSRGHIALDEVFNIGTGSLLTNFQSSPYHGDSLEDSYFTAVLDNLVKGGIYAQTSEDKLSHIFRALDCLCEIYKTKERDLRQNLDRKQKMDVESAVKDAIKFAEERLLVLENNARINGNKPQGDAIRAISIRMKQNQPYFERGFGRSVVNLIHKFCLNDVEVVESYYKDTPRSDNKKWIDVLPYYRGKTMHSACFKFHENENYREDVPRISKHLHDILLRIVLKMLSYDGTYQPTVKSTKSTECVDWVSPNTPASELGY